MNKIQIGILVLIILLLITLIIFSIIKNKQMIKESFGGVPRYEETPECKQYSKTYKDCDDYVDTFYNGGIIRNEPAWNCYNICQKDAIAYRDDPYQWKDMLYYYK